jgi:hypothetical protein
MKQRSIFFPLVLIAAGILWLLISMGRIPAENLWALAHFWPILLIAAGLGLILRSYWASARMLLDVLVVGIAVAAVVFAPQLNWTSPVWNLGTDHSFGGGVRGSGTLLSESRPVQGFTAVSIQYPAEVLIQQGNTESVKIEAENNLVAQLSTDVEMGTLVIRNKVTSWQQRVNPTKTVHITIVVKNLDNIDLPSAGSVQIERLETKLLNVRLSGTGDLKIDQLSAESMDCSLSGVGSVTASGTINDLKLVISGVGSFDGAKLISKNADARVSGAGSATVHPSVKLTAQMSGTGSIKYYGSPEVSKQISGLGSVEKIGE